MQGWRETQHAADQANWWRRSSVCGSDLAILVHVIARAPGPSYCMIMIAGTLKEKGTLKKGDASQFIADIQRESAADKGAEFAAAVTEAMAQKHLGIA